MSDLEELRLIQGGSIGDTLKFLYKQTPVGRAGLFLSGPRKHPTHRFKKFLEEKKGAKVTSLHIGRKPIISAVRKALDTISLGGFSKAKKRLGYTDVYHNYLVAGLDDGTFHKLERNHVIENKKATNADFANDLLDIPVEGKDLTLDKMVKNAGGDNPDFWVYRGRNNNCQNFTKDMVEKNGLAPDPEGESIDAYIPQDSKSMLDTIPKGLKWIPDLVTDIAGGADRATSLVADGLKPKKKRRTKCK